MIIISIKDVIKSFIGILPTIIIFCIKSFFPIIMWPAIIILWISAYIILIIVIFIINLIRENRRLTKDASEKSIEIDKLNKNKNALKLSIKDKQEQIIKLERMSNSLSYVIRSLTSFQDEQLNKTIEHLFLIEEKTNGQSIQDSQNNQ